MLCFLLRVLFCPQCACYFTCVAVWFSYWLPLVYIIIMIMQTCSDIIGVHITCNGERYRSRKIENFVAHSVSCPLCVMFFFILTQQKYV